MEPNTQMPPQMPTESSMQGPVSAPKHPHLGILLAILVIVIALAAGLFAWQMYVPVVNEDVMTPAPAESTSVESIESQGNSTQPSDIEADVDAQSSDEFDAEIDRAYVEFDAAFQE